jgi:Transthyretin-like family
MNRPLFHVIGATRAQFRLESKMKISSWIRSSLVGVLSVATLMLAGSALATDHLSGRVLGGGGPIANSTVSLWEASSNAPKKLAEAKTNDQGQFDLRSTTARGADSVLYVVATAGVPKAQTGDNPAIALLAVLGNKPPEKVVINEFSTIASVWTNTQFLDGIKLQGNALGLRIASGNVPNFVDLQTGGWGVAIQQSLNGGQTPTMSNFATLADVLAG